MKKLFALLLCFLSVFAFTACKSESDDALKSHISFLQTDSYYGECELYTVYLTAGEKEVPYIADGVCGDMKEFCRLTIRTKDNTIINGNFTYKFTYNEEEVSGVFSKDYGNSMSADTGVKAHAKGISNLIISNGENEYSVELKDNMADNKITVDKAYEIAKSEFKERIGEETADGKEFNKEINIKFVNDWTDVNSEYYYYVAFIGADRSGYAVLIDRNSGEIIAKR